MPPSTHFTKNHQGHLQPLINALKTIPRTCGIYRMVNDQGKDLYIGKAKNLHHRVSSYTHLSRLSHRLRQMVHAIADVKVLLTSTELEALFLEANLIKRYKPPYNILLKEGNAFSYLVLTPHPFPRVVRQRSPSEDSRAFGPFLSSAPLEAIKECLFRAFLLRSCSDAEFNQRRRPCLQYFIKRCSAPCVGKITQDAYADLVAQALDFLKGNVEKVQKDLRHQMDKFSQQQAYQQARIARDRLNALIIPPQSQGGLLNADVVVSVHQGDLTCVQLLCFRHGSPYGGEPFFFPNTQPQDGGEILTTLLRRLYEQNQPPRRIFLNHPVEDEDSLKILFRHHFNFTPHFIYPKKGYKKSLIAQAEKCAHQAIEARVGQNQMALWKEAAEQLGLPLIPQRIEVYDNSHHQGDCPVAVMVVASPEGFIKKAYRTFNMNIPDDIHPCTADSQPRPTSKADFSCHTGGCCLKITPLSDPLLGPPFARMNDIRYIPNVTRYNRDDYGMMRSVMKRRLTSSTPWPDLMIIDGGLGQLSAVMEVVRLLNATCIQVVAIAKTLPHDTLYVVNPSAEGHGGGVKPLVLPAHHPTLHLIQRLRDEAHRFAVHTHRRQKSRRMTTSMIQQLPGIGPKRHQALMHHFGTLDSLMKASVETLSAVLPLSLAKRVWEYLQVLR